MVHSESRCRHMLSAVGGVNESAPVHYAPDIIIAPMNMHLSLDFTRLTDKYVSGSYDCIAKQSLYRNTLTFANKYAPISTRKSLSLNAVGLDISSVDGVDQWNYTGKLLTLVWKTPFSTASETRDVKISYSLSHPVGGLYFKPNHAVSDNEPEKARYWFPCIDSPATACPVSVSLTCADGHVALANGHLQEKTTLGSTVTTSWRMDDPCPAYLICVAVGDYIQVDDGNVNGYYLFLTPLACQLRISARKVTSQSQI